MTRTLSRRTAVVVGIVIVVVIAVVVGVIVVASGSDGAEDGKPPVRPGFVYREGPELMLAGAPYRFVGVNNYDLTGCHTGEPVSEADAAEFFAGLPPDSVTRVWAFEEWGIEPLEQTERIAAEHNQKVIFTLADGAEHCNAPDFDPAWYSGGYRDKYIAWAQLVASTFRDSTAVAFWELMNEPGIAQTVGLNQEMMKGFYDESAARIKEVDPNHLVSTGAMAPWQEYQEGAEGYAYVHSGPNIDLVSFHDYDYPYTNGKDIVSAHFEAATAAAAEVGKPIYVGETGVSLKNGCMTAQQRADALRQKFDDYLAAGAVGVLYWVTLGPPNYPGPVCDSEVGTRDPMVGGPVMDMIAAYTNPLLRP